MKHDDYLELFPAADKFYSNLHIDFLAMYFLPTALLTHRLRYSASKDARQQHARLRNKGIF